MNVRLKVCLAILLASAAAVPVFCGEDDDVEAKQPPSKKKVDSPGFHMDHGPFVTASISDGVASFATDSWPNSKGNLNFAYKGIAVRLSGSAPATMCFDTDLMRVAFGWTGDYLKLDNTMLGMLRGTVNPSIAGTIKFSTKTLPGWAINDDRKDPRAQPYGPLPKSAAHYKGLYLNGNNVVFSYTVGGAQVLEMFGSEGSGSSFVFTRTIHIDKSPAPLTVFIADTEGASGPAPRDAEGLLSAMLEKDSCIGVAVAGTPKGAALTNAGGMLSLKLPALTAPATFKLCIWSGAKGGAEFEAAAKAAAAKVSDLPALCKGGPRRWDKQIDVRCEMGADNGPYTVDTLTLPVDNPWKAWVRSSGFDFLPDGGVAICEISGDVWISSPITPKLETLTWRRFATGMFEPLGLKVVDGKIYVLGRDQITRLHDLNSDGEADYYENFNNDRVVSPNYHAYAFDLQTDAAGNFYYGVCGHRVKPGLPNHACVIRVSKDGSKLEEYATGLRSPNGFGMGPGDVLTYSDNQGNYTPSSKVTRVKQGGFYGYKSHLVNANAITSYDPPIFWLPMTADNSSGGQAWVPDERWGPYKGQMIHLSYGKASLFLCCTEEINGTMQGGVVKIPLQFASGVMRARFNPADGQLYVVGSRGWQTSGAKDGCLNRVRYTGKPAFYPSSLRVKPTGIEIGFPVALSSADAGDATAYSVEQWNYNYSSAYGSPEFSVSDPKKKGRDTVEVKLAKLSADGKSVFLELGEMKPVMQMMIKYRIKSADGATIAHEIYNTINVVPGK
ncbi:MAG TPA: DUF6797 domain-containing protein [Planctomycetota bacterium]|nr:DUF6797 domain-containing protein [Planctomycetota bacterium]